MALAYQRQVRELFFGKKNVTVAPVAVGDVNFIQYGKGNQNTYMLQVKENTGKTIPSDEVISGQIYNVNVTAPVQKVGASYKYTMPGVIADSVGKTVMFDLKLHRSTSEDIFIHMTAARVIQTGDTNKIILEDIAGQLAFALGNDVRTSDQAKPMVTVASNTYFDNLYFTITTDATSFTITEKDWVLSTFSLTMPDMDIMWNLEGRLTDEIMSSTAVVKTEVAAGAAPVNQGYQLALFENFLMRGRAEFDTFNPGYALSRGSQITALDAQYWTVDVSHYSISRDDAKHSDKILTVAFESLALANAFADLFVVGVPGPKGDKGDPGAA